ncbi:thiamine pyrophosphate-dependent dehydrogenase E1 component subunit alpha [Planctobacterium marinum]|uniref:thiamine pyrophosphate-dependent dehydrogenase E1 component subunit alpha n=1 Tax=Planctobacterium marinum TaxID=1631968 RepID=UPI001E59F9D6|nr:thiamine pyrophosphate-dependent dehydrogenase E1 component subunit alpha [Planctobacterium marinum]MCC2606244.1 thiamine pyrophosphate-dependent dehydrogenase E1 component subunit alpha [Planctobacterium marinum]
MKNSSPETQESAVTFENMNGAYKLSVLKSMLRIRMVEEEIAKRYPQGKMRCPTHLSVGQECVPAVIGTLLSESDLAVSTHRAHAHYLAKGGDLKAMLAEIYGKQSGCCKGRGGSMHLIDEKVGFKGSTAIVGNTIPIGVGLALSQKLRGKNDITVVFLGDGAIEEGVFYEAANFAVVKKLPVLFVCENNLYSVYSPLKVRQPQGRKICDIASTIGLHSQEGDGNIVAETHRVLTTAIDVCRQGQSATFVELHTYRWREHCGPHYDNDIGYRSEAEFLAWKERDPIELYKTQLYKAKILDAEKLQVMIRQLETEIQDAFQFAETSPYPPSEQAYSPVFAQGVNINIAEVANG